MRNQTVFGRMHSPGGEAELQFDNLRVPKANILLGEGRGFEIAQGRLGPGRIHHCMRSVGQAQRALETMCRRVDNRVAFGRKLADQGSIWQDVAKSFCEIEQARLLTLNAADMMDRNGNKVAEDLIAAIKVVVPQMAQAVTDLAIQAHGGMGVSDDTEIAYFFALNRFLRLADGPDEVHVAQLGKQKIREYSALPAQGVSVGRQSPLRPAGGRCASAAGGCFAPFGWWCRGCCHRSGWATICARPNQLPHHQPHAGLQRRNRLHATRQVALQGLLEQAVKHRISHRAGQPHRRAVDLRKA